MTGSNLKERREIELTGTLIEHSARNPTVLAQSLALEKTEMIGLGL